MLWGEGLTKISVYLLFFLSLSLPTSPMSAVRSPLIRNSPIVPVCVCALMNYATLAWWKSIYTPFPLRPFSLLFSFCVCLCVLVCVAVRTNRTWTQLYTALTVQDLFVPRVYIDLYCVPVVPLCRSADSAKPKDIKVWGCSNSLAFFPCYI